MPTVDEHKAILHNLMREDHEEYIAEVRSWAEEAAAQGRTDDARRHREHLARLDAMEKPWETGRQA